MAKDRDGNAKQGSSHPKNISVQISPIVVDALNELFKRNTRLSASIKDGKYIITFIGQKTDFNGLLAKALEKLECTAEFRKQLESGKCDHLIENVVDGKVVLRIHPTNVHFKPFVEHAIKNEKSYRKSKTDRKQTPSNKENNMKPSRDLKSPSGKEADAAVSVASPTVASKLSPQPRDAIHHIPLISQLCDDDGLHGSYNQGNVAAFHQPASADSKHILTSIEDNETFAADMFSHEFAEATQALTNLPASPNPTTAAAAASATSFGLGMGLLGDEKERANDKKSNEMDGKSSATSHRSTQSKSITAKNVISQQNARDYVKDYNTDLFLRENNVIALLNCAYAKFNNTSVTDAKNDLKVLVISSKNRTECMPIIKQERTEHIKSIQNGIPISTRRRFTVPVDPKTIRADAIKSCIKMAINSGACFILIDDGIHWAAIGLLKSNDDIIKLVYFHPYKNWTSLALGSTKEYTCHSIAPTYVLELIEVIKNVYANKYKTEVIKVTININMDLSNSYSAIAALNIAALASYIKKCPEDVDLKNYSLWAKDLPFISYLCGPYSGPNTEGRPTAQTLFQTYIKSLYALIKRHASDDDRKSPKNYTPYVNEKPIELIKETEEELRGALEHYTSNDLNRQKKLISSDSRDCLADMPDYSIGVVCDLVERYYRSKNLNKSGQPYGDNEVRQVAEIVLQNDAVARNYKNSNTNLLDSFAENATSIDAKGRVFISEFELSNNNTYSFPYLRNGKTWKDIPNFAIITGKNGSGKSQLLRCINDSLKRGNREDEKYVLYIDVKKDLFNSYSGSHHSGSDIISRRKEYDLMVDEILGFINGNKSKPIKLESLKIIELINNQLVHKKVDRKAIDREFIKREVDRTITYNTDTSNVDEPLKILNIIFNQYEVRKDDLKKEIIQTFNSLPLFKYYRTDNSYPNKLGLEDFLQKIADDTTFRDDLIKRYIEDRLSPSPLEVINGILKKYSFEYHISLDKRERYGNGNEINFILKNDKGDQIYTDQLSSGQVMILCLMSWLYYYQGLTPNNEPADRQFDNQIKLMLLDEPDRHLDPQLSKLFFKIVYEEFVKCQGIQVIITTHRTDTIALIPPENLVTEVGNPVRRNPIVECGIYTIEKDQAKYVQIVPTTKLQAMFRLTRNLRELTDIHFKVHVESTDDAKFYEGVYHSLLFNSNEVRQSNKQNKLYWQINDIPYRVLSRRYQLAFYSVSKTKETGTKGDGGCTAVKLAINKDETAYKNMSVGNPLRWRMIRTLYSNADLYKPFGIIDNDYGRNIKEDKPDTPIVVGKKRHSLDNFLFDPFIFCYALTEPEIREYLSYDQIQISSENKDLFIESCLEIKSALITGELNKIQLHLEIYFKITLSSMLQLARYSNKRTDKKSNEKLINDIWSQFDKAVQAKDFKALDLAQKHLTTFSNKQKKRSDNKEKNQSKEQEVYTNISNKINNNATLCDEAITVIAGNLKPYTFSYPKEFLEVRGHDIQERFFRKDNPFKALDVIIQKVYEEGLRYIPLDLAQLFFDLNAKVRKVVRAVIKPGQAETAYQPIVGNTDAPHQPVAPANDSKNEKDEGKRDFKHSTAIAAASQTATGLPLPHSAANGLTMFINPVAVARYQKGLKIAKQIDADELLAASLQGSKSASSAVAVKSGDKKDGESTTPPPSQTAAGPLTPFPAASVSSTTALSSAPLLPTASAAPPKITMDPVATLFTQAALNPATNERYK